MRAIYSGLSTLLFSSIVQAVTTTTSAVTTTSNLQATTTSASTILFTVTNTCVNAVVAGALTNTDSTTQYTWANILSDCGRSLDTAYSSKQNFNAKKYDRQNAIQACANYATTNGVDEFQVHLTQGASFWTCSLKASSDYPNGETPTKNKAVAEVYVYQVAAQVSILNPTMNYAAQCTGAGGVIASAVLGLPEAQAYCTSKYPVQPVTSTEPATTVVVTSTTTTTVISTAGSIT